MPVYTYRCDNCEHEFDKHQSFDDKPLKSCPNCKKRKLNKVYKPARVMFKGSGYYVTDNRAKAAKSSSPAKGSNGKSESNGKSQKKEGKKTKAEKKTEKPSSKKKSD